MTASAVMTSMSRRQAWLAGIRPASLSASLVPVLVGTAAAEPHRLRHPAAFVAALLAAMLIQIGTNFTNDVFDYRSGADNPQRLGPRRLILSGAVTPRQASIAAVVVFATAALLGLYLITVGGWPILTIGVLSIVSGVIYTGGPWPVGYHGLGDVFSFTFFGPVAVVGSAYLQTLQVNATSIFASIPIGFLITAILVVNNLRDRETDREVGKRTLAVRLSTRATRIQYAALLIASYAMPPVILFTIHGSILIWLTWLTLPIAVSAIRTVATSDGHDLNRMLKRTGQINLLFGLLFAIGLWT